MTTTSLDQAPAWYTLGTDEVARALGTDTSLGLTTGQAARELERHGPNVLPREAPPSAWRIVLAQLADPMNAMLVVVAVVSWLVGQPDTGVLVAGLVLINVLLGTTQELKAKASVDALESIQIPNARVIRDGSATEIPAADLVPGDVFTLQPGDIVPADGRLAQEASLETVESSLTGESAPLSKGVATLPDADTALGDRSNMVFQNTSVSRGTATVIVTATGRATEMGKIAGLLGQVTRQQSPLQKELRTLTIRLATLAWLAVVVIVAIGFFRGLPTDRIVLLGITVAISSIPSGLPTFLTAMLSFGSQRLAKAKAVVRNLTDVETLGSTSAINSDKTGTLTMDMMTATRLFDSGRWFRVEGSGYGKQGAILGVAGRPLPDFEPLAYGLTLCSDATVSDDGKVIGDPTEAALVVLAAKMGVDAEDSRREYPRFAEVPFDSTYKFMATFHRAPLDGKDTMMGLVKGAPDVLLQRCAKATRGDDVVAIEDLADQVAAANHELGSQGLRVMSFAYREFDPRDQDVVAADPMAAVSDLTFVALVGIIDPLRPAAKEAVATALHAGIDVRMITGDHAVTAEAIATDLGLGPGVITGPRFQQLTDDELAAALPDLHVFGRVSPEDKLRLVTVMQEHGEIVAATGDAVNDAAALKKADIGVAMGSGSDVSKQAAKMVLTDDNFATLVHAIELGRDIYGKITSQIRYTLVGLFAVLIVMLLASAFNINNGQALTPVLLIFVTFLLGLFPAIGLSTDSVEPGIMDIPPRDPTIPILNKETVPRWFLYGLIVAAVTLVPYFLLPNEVGSGGPTVPQTMAFATVSFAVIFMSVSIRRGVMPGWRGPYFPYLLWLLPPIALSWLAIESEQLNGILDTVSLDGQQWAICLGLALVVPVVMEIEKGIRRARGVTHSA